jgi:hypothetical protein
VVPGERVTSGRLVVTKVSTSGEPGAGQVVAEVIGAAILDRAIVALPDGGFALLWLRGDDHALWYAAFDGAGTLTRAAREVQGIDVEGAGLSARVSRAGSIGVLFEGANESQHFVTLDASGDLRGPAHEVLERVDALEATQDEGFVLLGASLLEPGSPRVGDALLLMTTNDLGEPQGDAAQVATMSAGRTFWGAALVSHESGYLVAWSEARHPPGHTPWLHSTGSHSVISIQRVDRSGVRRGETVLLRAVQDSVADRRPALARFADAVAVFWSTGAYQYDCEMPEACSHRDRGQLVLIDPADLTPRSKLLEIWRDRSYPNGGSEPRLGDLLGTALNVREPEILITATLQDDDDRRSAPGFGSIRCE